MLFRNNAFATLTAGDGQTEQDVEYKVNGGTPPDPVPKAPKAVPLVAIEPAMTPPFDDVWYPIFSQTQGPYAPSPGQKGPWTVQFRVNGVVIDPAASVFNPEATVILIATAPGTYKIIVA